MQPEIRRIIATDAHRRRTGHCPAAIHSLGTGESFAIEATEDGFIDVASGIRVRTDSTRILLPGNSAVIDVVLDDDIAFSGYDSASGERFSGRSGGGCSVTIYDDQRVGYFQYAIADQSG
jgi:hypothetical protein